MKKKAEKLKLDFLPWSENKQTNENRMKRTKKIVIKLFFQLRLEANRVNCIWLIHKATQVPWD